MQSASTPTIRPLVRTLAGLVVLLGTTVLIGWFAQRQTIVQISPQFVPMHFNTALCFTLTGIGILFVLHNRRTPALLTSISVLALSAATLVQYITRINFGVDEILWDSHFDLVSPHPIKMAPNTAINFFAVSLALLLSSSALVTAFKNISLCIIASFVLAVGIVALFGYVTSLIPAFGWGSDTPMAPHTSLGFVLVGATLLVQEWSKIDTYKDYRELVLASVVPLALTIGISVFAALVEERRTAHKKVLNADGEILRLAINQKLIGITNNIIRMSALWPELSQQDGEPLRAYASLLLRDFEPIRTIEWVDKDMIIRWAEPETTANEFIGINLGDNQTVSQTLNDARVQGMIFSDQIYMEPFGSSVLLVNPVFIAGNFDGWMLARIDIELLLESFNPIMEQLGIAAHIQQKSGIALTHIVKSNSPYLVHKPLQAPGQDWQLVVNPLDSFFKIYATPLTSVTTFLTFISAALLLWLVHLLLKSRQNSNELGRLHQRLESAFDTMMDGIIILSDQGVIEEANRTASHIFGYSYEEILGLNISQLMPHPLEVRQLQDAEPSSIFQQPGFLGKPRTYRALTKQGEEFPVELNVTEAKNRGRTFYTGVIRDLSEKIATEEKLAERESLVNVAVYSSPLAIAIADLYGHYVDANPAFCNWLGYTKEELIGMSIVETLSDEDKETGLQRYQELAGDKRQIVRREKQYRKKNGDYVWGLMCASVIKNARGEVTHIASQILDIEEEKKLRQALELQNHELEVINAELDQFAYIASHDLKEPLRTMRTFSSYLIKDLEKKDQARITEDIKFIDDAALRMSNLIDDLLRLSRAGNQTLAPTPVDLNNCVQEALSQLQATIKETGADIKVADLPTINGDAAQLTSVFLNLIHNAIKFQRAGETPILSIEVLPANDTYDVTIAVKDNGIGIDASHINDIFGAFNKLHSPNQYAGTGIGLAIVKKIVERHGGKIEVRSSENEGSQFILYFSTLT